MQTEIFSKREGFASAIDKVVKLIDDFESIERDSKNLHKKKCEIESGKQQHFDCFEIITSNGKLQILQDLKQQINFLGTEKEISAQAGEGNFEYNTSSKVANPSEMPEENVKEKE